MLLSPVQMTIFMVVAVLLAFGVCVLGLQNGVERITKVMMILLICLMIVLAVHSLLLPNMQEGLAFISSGHQQICRRLATATFCLQPCSWRSLL